MDHSWTILKERNRLEEQVSAGKLDPSKQFDFSEIYIFGKYENFVKRVSNINELLNTIQNFRTDWNGYILIGQLRWTNERIEFSTNQKARWKNATLRELKLPIQTLTQLLNLSRENHMIFLIIARYYVIYMTSHMLKSIFCNFVLGKVNQIARSYSRIGWPQKVKLFFDVGIWPQFDTAKILWPFWQTPLRYDYRIFD